MNEKTLEQQKNAEITVTENVQIAQQKTQDPTLIQRDTQTTTTAPLQNAEPTTVTENLPVTRDIHAEATTTKTFEKGLKKADKAEKIQFASDLKVLETNMENASTVFGSSVQYTKIQTLLGEINTVLSGNLSADPQGDANILMRVKGSYTKLLDACNSYIEKHDPKTSRGIYRYQLVQMVQREAEKKSNYFKGVNEAELMPGVIGISGVERTNMSWKEVMRHAGSRKLDMSKIQHNSSNGGAMSDVYQLNIPIQNKKLEEAIEKAKQAEKLLDDKQKQELAAFDAKAKQLDEQWEKDHQLEISRLRDSIGFKVDTDDETGSKSEEEKNQIVENEVKPEIEKLKGSFAVSQKEDRKTFVEKQDSDRKSLKEKEKKLIDQRKSEEKFLKIDKDVNCDEVLKKGDALQEDLRNKKITREQYEVLYDQISRDYLFSSGMVRIANASKQKGKSTINSSRRSVATCVMANLMNMGELVAQSELVDVEINGKTQQGILMEKAKGLGQSELARQYEHPDGTEPVGVSSDVQRQLVNLQILDVICGQMDRHLNNIKVDVDEKNMLSTIKAIDHDYSFGKNGILFQSNFCNAVKIFEETVDKTANDRKTGQLAENGETPTLCLPYISEEIAITVPELARNTNMIKNMLKPLLEEDEIDALIGRLQLLNKAIEKFPKDHILKKGEWNDKTATAFIEKAEKTPFSHPENASSQLTERYKESDEYQCDVGFKDSYVSKYLKMQQDAQKSGAQSGTL